ncbi:hypothetical protein EDC18_101477 [Natranaerovirga pectinivora]|uniref:DUF4179 domain-containing protein n=1 Tax=Natranaerovirga pectinivora TaxID=682400 RepID=A0A4V2V0Q1_9FIRM|nr:hypothetical protein [Natranaerovirga pectinivora]TCT17179.1 hypothetical protein EDC18_101477 [Natranaerovirga pectinivora]
MDKNDKEILNILKEFSQEECVHLMENLFEDGMDINDLQQRRMGKKVLKSIKPTKPIYQKKFIAALCMSFIILFMTLTSFGQKIIAEIGKRFYFIPGIGTLVETDLDNIYILSRPVVSKKGDTEITVISAQKEGNRLILFLRGKGIGYSFAREIYIVKENGEKIPNDHFIWGSGDKTSSGYFTYYNLPNDLTTFDLQINDFIIPIELETGAGYQDYSSMGPTDINNGLGITLVPVKINNMIHFSLVDHIYDGRSIYLYGKVDKNHNSDTNILIEDEHNVSYSYNETPDIWPKSNFEFQPSVTGKNYHITIPEVTLQYKVNHEVSIPVPTEGETKINKKVRLLDFEFEIIKSIRNEDTIRVFINTKYNENKSENLSLLHFNTYPIDGGYGWTFDDTTSVEYYDIPILSDESEIIIQFTSIITNLEGPWAFEIDIDTL